MTGKTHAVTAAPRIAYPIQAIRSRLDVASRDIVIDGSVFARNEDEISMKLRHFDVLDLGAFAGLIVSLAVALSLALTTDAESEGTSLIAEPAELRLGKVEQTESIPFEFMLINQSRAPIVVQEVTPPCTCTKVDWPSDTTIDPGERRRVRGRIRTVGIRGTYEPVFAISYIPKTKDGDALAFSDTLLLPMKLEVTAAIQLSKDQIEIATGSWSEVILTAGGTRDFAIKGIEASDSFILHELADAHFNEDGRRFQIRLGIDGPKLSSVPVRDSKFYWVGIATSEPMDPEITIPVTLIDE